MSQDAINISLIHPFRRFTPGSCSWPHTSPTLHLRNGAGNRRYAQDGENEARMNDVRSEGTVNRLPSRSLTFRSYRVP